MQAADLSVVIPVFNAGRFLPLALQSVFRTFQGAEIILVDDESTDGCTESLQDFPPVTLIRKKNGGPGSARNVGLKNATRNFVYFFDADDLLLEEGLGEALVFLRANPTQFAVAGPMGPVIDQNGKVLGTFEAVFGVPGFPKAPLLKKAHLLPPRILSPNLWLFLFRRSFLQTVGEFDESLRITEDLEYLYRVFERTEVPVLNQPFVAYRIHGNNVSCRRTESGATLNLRNRVESLLVDWSHTHDTQLDKTSNSNSPHSRPGGRDHPC